MKTRILCLVFWLSTALISDVDIVETVPCCGYRHVRRCCVRRVFVYYRPVSVVVASDPIEHYFHNILLKLVFKRKGFKNDFELIQLKINLIMLIFVQIY